MRKIEKGSPEEWAVGTGDETNGPPTALLIGG